MVEDTFRVGSHPCSPGHKPLLPPSPSCGDPASAAPAPAGAGAPSGPRDCALRSDAFRMNCYKVLMCSNRSPHAWKSCPFAHPGEQARRRPLSLFRYEASMCPAARQGKECPLGNACPKSHNAFELWLHPDKFKTRLCSKGTQCPRKVCFFAHTQEELRHPPPAHSHPAALAAAQDDSGSGAGAPAPWAPRPAASAEAGAAAGGGRCAVGGPGAATSYVALGAAEAAALRAACATGAFASALAPEHSPLGSLPRPPGRRPPCEPGPPAAPAAWAALLPGEPLQQLLAASAEMAGPGISGGGAGGLPARCAEELAMQQLLQRAALQRQQAQMQEQHGWDELQQERLRRVRMQQTQLGAASSSPAASSSRGQHELRGLQEQQAQQQQAEALLLQAMIESRAAAATQQAAGAASGAAGCAPVVAPTMAAPAAGGWPQAAASAASPVPVAREAAQQLAGCMPLGASSCALNAEAGLLMSPAAFPPGGVPVVAAIPTPPFSPAPAAAPCGWPAAAAPPFSPAAVAAPGSVLSAGGHGTLVVWGVPPSAILNPQNQVSPAAAQQGQWQLGAGCHTNGWPLGR